MAGFIWFCIVLIVVGLLTSKHKKSPSQKSTMEKFQAEVEDEIIEQIKARMQTAQNTYYDLLGVPTNASQAQITAAYKKLVKKYHPDHNSYKDAAEKFMKIMDAYELLRNKEKRAEYDSSLSKQYKKIFLIGASVQNLRHTIAKQMQRDPKTIKFTQTGDIFINDTFAFCWCVVSGFFVYYEPAITEYKKFDPALYEIILLTSYTTVELKQMIAINFGCLPEDIKLADDGSVLICGEYALCWRLSKNEYFEYYAPITKE